MDRRDFLKRLAGAAAIGTAAVVAGIDLDPERLLWVPGKKTIFLPPAKPLVTDAATVAREFQAVVEADINAVLHGAIAHRVHTGLGVVESDAAWNVVRINRHPVTAAQAALARLNHFQWHDRGLAGSPEHVEMTERVVAERLAAGWSDPIGAESERVWERVPRTVVPRRGRG